ncbi:MAG: cytidylyltransferase domain-containing protein [Candidatus Odinarchaeia archaeon]
MYKGNNVLLIIPARGGSKGIPRKNLRIIGGRPLIVYVIESAKKAKYVDKVVVSTEDEEIADVASLWNANVIARPLELASDDVPLDPVIHHAVTVLETQGEYFDIIITLQPTLPLVSSDTIDKGIKMLVEQNYDCVVGVSDATHLYWIKKNGVHPLFEERRNRQFLAPIYKECGFFLSKRKIVTQNSRIGGKIGLLILPKTEAVDVDSYEDLWVIEGILKKTKIAIRVDGDDVGLGHVYRMLSLASRLIHHDIRFYMCKNKVLGIKKVKENNFPVFLINDNTDFLNAVQEFKPDIVINDILDTEKEYILALRNQGIFVVNFEDLGEGSEYANIVFNALYESSNPPQSHYYGYRYVILRQDFYYYPIRELSPEVNNILLTFGGVDENNLTLKTLTALEKINFTKNVTVILGLGYKHTNSLKEFMEKSKLNIELHRDVKSMARFVYNADIAVTSKGRTIYEIASLAVPCVAIAQNEREMLHLFADLSRGIVSLGLAYNLSIDKISKNLQRIINNYELREKLHRNLRKYNLKRGIDNVIEVLFRNYYNFAAENRGPSLVR